MSKLQRLSAAVDRFISKASKKNEPLEAFRTTEDYKEFEQSIADAILDQVTDITKKLPKWMITDEELDEDRAAKWLEDNQKSIAKYLKEKDVYAVLAVAFTYSVESCYQRQGIKLQKAADPFVTFELTNSYYIDKLLDQANYLLNKSSIDETTRNRMITLIRDTRMNMTTIDELANIIADEFEGISETRAFSIANTEANQAMSSAQQAFLKENGVATRSGWVLVRTHVLSVRAMKIKVRFRSMMNSSLVMRLLLDILAVSATRMLVKRLISTPSMYYGMALEQL